MEDTYCQQTLKKEQIISMYMDTFTPQEMHLCRMIKNKETVKIKKISFCKDADYAGRCKIEPLALKKLAKARWPSLKKLLIGDNILINEEGCKYIAMGNWDIIDLDIGCNYYCGDNGIKQLSKAHWTNLIKLNLRNWMLNKGCKWLSQAQWYSLKEATLQRNQMVKVGSRWLSKVNWTKLSYITIKDNKICWKSCKYLSACNWPQINYLQIYYNKKGEQGLLYFLKSNWKKITKINASHKNKLPDSKYMESSFQRCFPIGQWIVV